MPHPRRWSRTRSLRCWSQSRCSSLLGDLRDLERLGLLGVVRVLGAGVDLELRDQLITQTVLGKHAADRLLDRLAGILVEQVTVGDGLESARVAAVAVGQLVGALVARQGDL